MYRLLIVEDERWEREGLRDFLDWGSMRIEVVGCACNGMEGLRYAEQYHPDIILTDIKMPKMDGIQMANKIRSFLPYAKIIILSGYDDFEYAKQTFNFHAFDYILKPIEKKSIKEVILRAISALDCDKSMESERASLKNKLTQYFVENKNNILLKILEDNELEFTSEELSYKFLDTSTKIVIAVLSISSTSLGCNNFDTDRFETIMHQRGVVYSFTKPSKEAALCIEAPETIEELRKILSGLADYLKNEIGLDVIMSVGEVVNGYSGAANSYSQAKEVGSCRFLAEYGDILFYEEIKQKYHMDPDFARPIVIRVNEIINKIIVNIQKNQVEECCLLLDSFLMELRDILPLSKLLMNKFFVQALLNLHPSALNNNSTHYKEYILDKSRFEEQLLRLNSIVHTKEYLKEFIKSVAAYTMNNSCKNTDIEVTQRVIKLIEDRYAEEIGLQSISSDIHLTPYYIGSIFKKNTGKTFNQYLCDYRIERAKEMLQKGKTNVSQLSYEVGIKNTSYFCSLFKNKFGISPGDYKEMMKGGR